MPPRNKVKVKIEYFIESKYLFACSRASLGTFFPPCKSVRLEFWFWAQSDQWKDCHWETFQYKVRLQFTDIFDEKFQPQAYAWLSFSLMTWSSWPYWLHQMELIKQSIWRIAKQIIIQYWKLDAQIVINFNLEEIIASMVTLNYPWHAQD